MATGRHRSRNGLVNLNDGDRPGRHREIWGDERRAAIGLSRVRAQPQGPDWPLDSSPITASMPPRSADYAPTRDGSVAAPTVRGGAASASPILLLLLDNGPSVRVRCIDLVDRFDRFDIDRSNVVELDLDDDRAGSGPDQRHRVPDVGARLSDLPTAAALDEADEQYNEDAVNLTTTRTELAATQSAIDPAKSKLAEERDRLRQVAIESYVGSGSSDAIAELFATPSSASQTQYLRAARGGKCGHRRGQGRGRSAAAPGPQSKLQSEQQTETAQLTSENQARASAVAASNQAEATLNQVQGTLAQEIAQQAATGAPAAAQQAAQANTAGAEEAAAAAPRRPRRWRARWAGAAPPPRRPRPPPTRHPGRPRAPDPSATETSRTRPAWPPSTGRWSTGGALRLGRCQRLGSRLLRTHHAGLGPGRRVTAAFGGRSVHGHAAREPVRSRAGRPPLLRPRRVGHRPRRHVRRSNARRTSDRYGVERSSRPPTREPWSRSIRSGTSVSLVPASRKNEAQQDDRRSRSGRHAQAPSARCPHRVRPAPTGALHPTGTS